MKTYEDFKAEAARIVVGAHRTYPFAEGVMNLEVELSAVLDATTAGAASDVNVVLGTVPELPESAQSGWQALKCSITSPVLLSGSTTLGITWTFSYSRAGAALVPIATYVGNTTPAGDLVADTETQATLVAAAGLLKAGDVLVLVNSHASTGTAIPNGVYVKVELHYD
jgi:hypothetical protein